MRASWMVILLATLTLVLGGIAAGVGFFQNKGADPKTFTTIHGSDVKLYGQGLYRHDTLFFGGGFKGQDAVVLFFGVPLLIIGILLYYRGSFIGHLMLVGLLGYFLYVYASMALGAAYNPLFLVYTAVSSFSLYGLILSFNSAVLRFGVYDNLVSLPGKAIAIFMFIAGGITLFVWGSPLIAALFEGSPPVRMDSYTTMVTYAIDLAVITPATIICGVLILRGNAAGYVMAAPLLTLIVLLAPQILISTIFQQRVGVPFSQGEMIGPVAGFVILGSVGLWLLISLFRSVSKLT